MKIAGNTLRKRKDGSWELRITYRGRQKSFYGRTQALVAAKYRQWRDIFCVEPQYDNSVTVEQWATRWMVAYKEKTVASSTYVSIKGMMRRYVIPSLGYKKLASLTSLDCQEFFNSISHMGNTKNKVRFYLNDMLNRAAENYLICRNPAQSVEVAKSKSTPSTALTKAEQLHLKNFDFGNELTHKYFLFVLYTGCRKSEALKFDHIKDVQNGHIIIHGTKTNTSARIIPYFDNIAELFKNDKTINFQNLATTLNVQLHKCLPNHTIMDLRTTFATNCHEIGVSPKVVQKWLGHSNMSMTMNTYTQVLDSFEKSEAKKVSEHYKSQE